MSRPPAEGEGALWYDDEAGPLVRAYTITGGRTCPAVDARLDLIAVLVANPVALSRDGLDEAHLCLLELCARSPLSVADIASEADLAVGVVRVLLGDLLRDGHIRVVRPVRPAELPDVGLLREVINGLRAL